MGRFSAFQLRMLGDSADQIRRAVLDDFITETVLVEGARSAGLDQSPAVKERELYVLGAALLAQVREEVGDGSDITDAELERFFDANKERYQADQAIQLWQIVVENRALAEQLIAQLTADPEVRKDPARRFGELAEQHSVDDATKHRQGNLGFVRRDGSTDRPGERVATALYVAASKVQDGQIVPEPVEVGGRWVVLQRRAKRDKPEISFEGVKESLRTQLLQLRLEQRTAELKAQLRRDAHVEILGDRVTLLDVRADLDGEIVAAKRPGGLPHERRAAAAPPRPAGPPGQLR
jgi:peptidyl-prolyl cis-trans isomerase C